MEYCFNTNIDLLETAKLLSPWLLAWVIYLIWHKQKEKEFIANEAKDILRVIDNLIYSYYSIHVQYHLYVETPEIFSEDNYKLIINDNEVLKKDFDSKIKFLLNLINDCNIYENYQTYEKDKVFFEITEVFDENINKLEKLNISSNNMEKSLSNIKLDLVKYAMYKKKVQYKSA